MKLSKIKLFMTIFGLCYAMFLPDLLGKNSEPDARYLKLVKTYRFNSDGSYVYDYEHRLLYNSYYSFHRLFGETFIVYNPAFQKLEIMTSETQMSDGTLVRAPKNAFNEVLPSWATHSGAYNHFKEMVVTHTGLECGAIAHLQYTIFSSSEPQGFRHFSEPLIREIPIDTLMVTIVVPDGIPFRFSQSVSLKPQSAKEGENTKYIFTLTNIKAKDPYGLLSECDEPRLIFQVGEKSLEQLLKDFGEENSPMQSITDVQWDLALDIRSKIALVNTTAVPSMFQILPIQSPTETLKRNSGTPLEKAILLIQLLKEAGIPSKLLLKFPENTLDTCISNFASHNGVYVAVKHGQTPVVLSTEAHQKIGIKKQSGYVYVYLDQNGIGNLWKNASLNVDTKIVLTLNSQGNYSGNEATTYHDGAPLFLTKTGNVISAKELTGRTGDVVSYETTPEGKLSYIAQWEQTKADMVGNTAIIPIPLIKYGFDVKYFLPLPELLSEQIRVDVPLNEQMMVELMLPKGAKLFMETLNQKITGNFGSVELSVVSKGSKVIYTRKISITQSIIAPEEIHEFKQAMNFIGSQRANLITIQLP